MPTRHPSMSLLDRDWLVPSADGEPFLSRLPDEYTLNWSEELGRLHEHCSRWHFIDVWTRRAMLERLGPVGCAPTILDIGCSTGYLLADLRARLPGAALIGVDLLASALRKAQRNVEDALLLQADACRMPLLDRCVDVALSANLLEHVPDDTRVLSEIHRVLRPGGRAVIVVPVDPSCYDYYDRLLGHERRYARAELAHKAASAGLAVVEDARLGAVLYPAFWAVKQRNRMRYGLLRGEALERRVIEDMESTVDSKIGRWACRIDDVLLKCHVRLPFGIRGLTVLERPGSGG